MIGGVFREGQMKGGVVVNLNPFTWTRTCYVKFNFKLSLSHLHELLPITGGHEESN